MSGELIRLRQTDRWIAWVRLGAVPFAVFQVSITNGYPHGYERAAWLTTGIFALGTGVLLLASRLRLDLFRQRLLGCAALGFDTGVVCGYIVIYSFQHGGPTRQLLYLAVVEAAVRFGMLMPLAVTAATVPVLLQYEHLRSHRAGESFHAEYVTMQVGGEVILGLIVGRLVRRLQRETALSEGRAVEAEQLRDALGRRVDVLEAANRCARALASSLDLEEAFGAFIRELRGLVPFDRLGVVLVEGDRLEVLATAGVAADEVFPPGSLRQIEGSIFEAVADGRTVYRRDIAEQRHPEEEELLELGLRCRLTAPLLVGTHAIGLISFVDPVEVSAFTHDGRVFVEVRDRGPGIPREQQRLIFEKFGRVKSTGAKPGTGLGLFIARSIAEAHGGTLDVHSLPGQGAAFRLALPVEAAGG